MNVFRIVGVLAMLWGGSIVVSFFLRSAPIGTGAYSLGEYSGVAMGGILFLAGLYATITGGRKKRTED